MRRADYNGGMQVRRLVVRIAALLAALGALPLAAQKPAAPAPGTAAKPAQAAAPGATPTPAASLLGEAPRVTYSKSFRGSVPSFLEVTIQQTGAAEFQCVDKPGDPPVRFEFTVAPPLLARVFALTRSLDDFASPVLESKSKVGYMGTKMLAYDDDTHHAQQTFNYTSVPAARDLADVFERIASTGDHAARLSHAVRYDHLGVVQELDGITQDWRQRQLLAPELLRPVLEQVVKDPALMDIAHRRANDLLAAMRDTPRVR